MQITVTHRRAFSGSDIHVEVAAGPNESIESVEVDFDGFTLESSECAPGTQEYTRDFPAVGSGGPGEDHQVIVTAIDQSGTPHSTTTQWTDTN